MMELISSPAALWILLATIVLVCGGLIFYALRYKGDVFAELSHGATSFKLEAKDRPQKN
jgi:hypothetical protein